MELSSVNLHTATGDELQVAVDGVGTLAGVRFVIIKPSGAFAAIAKSENVARVTDARDQCAAE